ncbi:MAG: AAA family ATPase [Bacteroidetes bacterium]|nr:AAA family ATPase [Bacteroidota bacterium]
MSIDQSNYRLKRLTLNGFKTIHSLTDFNPLSKTVLIGPNCAGKSNFLSFFQMINWAMSGHGNLSHYILSNGGAGQFVHDGLDQTDEINAELTMETADGEYEYFFKLNHDHRSKLFFSDEKYRRISKNQHQQENWTSLGSGHQDPEIRRGYYKDPTAELILNFLNQTIVYQFQNTSSTSRIHRKWSVNDSIGLKEDGGNIAAVLYRLKVHHTPYYIRIVDTIRILFPQFSDFELVPEFDFIMLRWKEYHSDEVFYSAQGSDGFLRIIALITLLLQPPDRLPSLLIIDEPALGLHPLSTSVIGGLINAAALKTQVIIATQSVLLLDCFFPEDVVVVERRERATVFRRLEHAPLKEWLEDYSLSELWEKNIIGGRP